MGERQQPDGHLAGAAQIALLLQRLEGAPIGGAGEQLVAIDEVGERHRLAPQRVDDVVVIDHMAALDVGHGPSSAQAGHRRGSEEAFEPVVEDANPQAVTDQPRRHGVEHAPQREAARRGHGDRLFLVIRGATLGQRRQRGLLQRDALDEIGVALADDAIDERAISVEIGEVARATQQQRVFQRLLEMAMGAFDRAVLMRDADIVARRHHAVMVHQRGVALGDIVARIGGKIAERRREAVAAMLLRRAAERPQGVLQTLGQGGEALSAEHDMGVLETGEDQSEVIEPVVELFSGDGDAEAAGVGEVGKALPPGLMQLAENDLLLRPVKATPRLDAALQGAADVAVEIGMAPTQLLEHADHPNTGRGLEDRHDLGVPIGRQRVGPSPASRPLLLRGRTRIGFKPVSGRS